MIMFASTLGDVRMSKRMLQMTQTKVTSHTAPHCATTFYSVEGKGVIDRDRVTQLEKTLGLVVINKPK